MDLEVIRQRLVVDASQYQAGMVRASTTTSALGSQAIGTERGLHMLERGMLGLATSAAMIPGPIGHISAALAGMQLSMGFLLTITAILAGAALLFKKLGDEAKLAADNVTAGADRMQKSLNAFVGAHTAEGAQGPLGLAMLRHDLVEAQARLAQMHGPATAEEVLTTGPLDRSTEAIRAQETWVGKLTEAISRLEYGLHQLRVRELQESALAAAQLAKEMQKVTAAFDFEHFGKFSQRAKGEGRNALGLMPKGAGKGALDILLPGEAELLRLNEAEQRRLSNLGISIGRTLMQGIMDGMANMQDVLKAIFFQILEFAMGGFFKGILGDLGIGGSATKSLGGVAKSVVSPASMAMNLNMSGLAPVTAYFVAKDPGFQQMLRDGLLVAASQGFKGGR